MEGSDSEDEYNKKKGIKKKKQAGKTFKIRKCPKCGSDDVSVVLGFDEGKGKGEWECKKCKWLGKNLKEEEFPLAQLAMALSLKRKKLLL